MNFAEHAHLAPEITPPGSMHAPMPVEVVFRVPDDQMGHLPDGFCLEGCVPHGGFVPRRGDVVYLTPASAWGVAIVIHDWTSRERGRVEVWLEHVGAGLMKPRDPGCLTH